MTELSNLNRGCSGRKGSQSDTDQFESVQQLQQEQSVLVGQELSGVQSLHVQRDELSFTSPLSIQHIDKSAAFIYWAKYYNRRMQHIGFILAPLSLRSNVCSKDKLKFNYRTVTLLQNIPSYSRLQCTHTNTHKLSPYCM